MLGVMCLVALLQLVRSFLLVLSILVFSAYRLCVLMCAVRVIGWSLQNTQPIKTSIFTEHTTNVMIQ